MNSFDNISIIEIKQASNTAQTLSGKTAVIELLEGKQRTQTIELPYFSREDIFRLLENKSDLILDNALVEDFNLDLFRKEKNISPAQYIELKNFSAENTIFHSTTEINFRKARFTGTTASFKDATFISKKINFSETDFSLTQENFHSISAHCQEINFTSARFGKNYHDFRNSKFSGKKIFENLIFLGGEVDFVGVEFGEGDVNFTGTAFGGGRVLFRMAIFGKGRKDFSRVNFGGGDVSFEKVEFGDGDVNFRSVIFGNGKKDFRRCSFGEGKLNFANADFGNGTVDFVSTDFGRGKTSFKLTNFGRGNKDFHYCHWGDGDLQFDKTNFGTGDIDFRAVDFDNCRVIFNRVEIASGDIIFEASQMQSGYITFKNSILGRGEFNFSNCIYPRSDIILENIDFGQGAINFKAAKFQKIIFRNSQINNYSDLRVSECHLLDLSETVIKDVVDLKTYSRNINIQSIDLRGVRLLGQIYLSWNQLKIRDLILQQNSTWQEKAEQFRMLKENFHNLGMYNEEDRAYVEFKRAEAQAILENRKKAGFPHNITGRISHWLKILIMDKMGNYATNPMRVLLSMLIVYLLFTFTYLLLETVDPSAQIVSSLFPSGDPRILSKVGKAFYHSAITFLTIGYGDYYPNGISRWLSAIEGFIGLFMMSYFTVAFVRKILR